jgi:hypothetical protein
MRLRSAVWNVALISSVLVLGPTAARAQTSGEPIRLVGGAIDVNSARTGMVEIDVTRWSTKAEADRLMETLRQKGPDALLEALQKNPVTGTIRTPGQLAYDLRYARRMPLPDGGSRITLATDRRMSFWEITNQPRSVDYPFTWIQIHLNTAGEGEGRMSLATKITVEESNIVLENYQLQPVLLKSIKEEKLKR